MVSHRPVSGVSMNKQEKSQDIRWPQTVFHNTTNWGSIQARNLPSWQIRLEESPATHCHSSLSLGSALVPEFLVWGSLFLPCAAWATLLLPEVTSWQFPPSYKCMSSSHCILPRLHLSCLSREVLHLERCQTPVSHPLQWNTPASSCNSSHAAGELQKHKPRMREVTLSLHRGCHSTAGDSRGGVTPCSKSSFGCCLIVEKALRLLCVKCQGNCLACLPIPLPALLGALPTGANKSGTPK